MTLCDAYTLKARPQSMTRALNTGITVTFTFTFSISNNVEVSHITMFEIIKTHLRVEGN